MRPHPQVFSDNSEKPVCTAPEIAASKSNRHHHPCSRPRPAILAAHIASPVRSASGIRRGKARTTSPRNSPTAPSLDTAQESFGTLARRSSWGHCGSLVCAAASTANAAPAAINNSDPIAVRPLIDPPSLTILSACAQVENPLLAQYNHFSRLLAPPAAWYKQFSPVALPIGKLHRQAVFSKEI